LDSLKNAAMIIHAGDYTSKTVLDQLRKLRSFRGVYGNADPPEIRLEVPERTIFDFAGWRIGVTHPAEGGMPFGNQNRIRKRFEQVDLIVYGHSHNAKREAGRNIDVVYAYLVPRVNTKLAPRLARELKEGARIVTHEFAMPWSYDKRIYVRKAPLHLYVMSHEKRTAGRS